MKISKSELQSKYGIALSAGKYSIKVDGGFYRIFSVKDDTEGCLLPGVRNSLVTVGHSRDNLAKLKAIVLPAIKAGQMVELEIIPATGVQA